jgi:hypothetical protein
LGAELSIQGARYGALFHARNGIGCLGALALCTALNLALSAAPASAQYYYRIDSGFWQRPKHRAVKHVSKEQDVSKDSFGDIPKGPLQIFISIDQQKLHLYSDGMHVADTSIATGVPSLPTPLGVFSVIQKQVFHRSNLYSDAPMPFMQRITWSGVALHEGESIGHQASHGCIRMPHDFAVRLYRLTKLGVPVVIAQPELKPAAFADPHLFVHRDKPPEPSPAAAPAVSAAAPAAGVALDPAPPVTAVAAGASALGLRVNSDGNGAPSVALTPVADAAKSNPPIDGGPKPGQAAKLDGPVPTPPAEPADLVKIAPASRSAIAIFISRKEKKIYVRQDFAPLFQAPVTIADPDKPLGTLVFTALGFIGDDHTTLRWDVVALPSEPPLEPKRKADRETRSDRYDRGRRHSEEREKPADLPPQTPAEALARIDIPPAAIDYVSQLIVPGSSLIVSDHGLGDETGEGTNFIVVLR